MDSPLLSGHCKGLVAVGHVLGVTLRAGCPACLPRGMCCYTILPGKCMYVLHWTGPELPTMMGMQSICVHVVHYTQEENYFIFGIRRFRTCL